MIGIPTSALMYSVVFNEFTEIPPEKLGDVLGRRCFLNEPYIIKRSFRKVDLALF